MTLPDEKHFPLEPDEPAMRALVEDALERVVRHLTSLENQRASQPKGGLKVAQGLETDFPDGGTAGSVLLHELFQRVIPPGIHTAHPGYLAYIPGGGLFASAVADFITSAVNRYVGIFQAAPVLAQIERNVLQWCCSLVGFGAGSGGVMTSGGSMSNLLAIHTARAERLPENFLNGRIYVSEQVHHSVLKAARIAGFPRDSVCSIPTDQAFRMDTAALQARISQHRAEGKLPFLVVASAGTTNTGAVDPLQDISRVAKAEGLWLHVDAAYGGFFLLTQRGRALLDGMQHADSITLDPHKGLFLPYGTGCLVVRELAALARAHTIHADYLPSSSDEGEELPRDFCDLSVELSREARGVRVWLPLRLHGVAPFRAALDEKLDLAAYAATRLAHIPQLTLVAAPTLSLLAFRLTPPGMTVEALDALNRRLMKLVNARGRVLLSGTRLDGIHTLRLCVLSFRTHRDHINHAVEDLLAAVKDLRPEM